MSNRVVSFTGIGNLYRLFYYERRDIPTTVKLINTLQKFSAVEQESNQKEKLPKLTKAIADLRELIKSIKEQYADAKNQYVGANQEVKRLSMLRELICSLSSKNRLKTLCLI